MENEDVYWQVSGFDKEGVIMSDSMFFVLALPLWGILIVLMCMLDVLMKRLPKFTIDITIEKAGNGSVE